MQSKKQRKQEKIKQKQLTSEKKTDPRFLSASYDPKFVEPSKSVTKVKVDKRFSKMMTDPEFQVGSTVDKYGRNNSNDKSKKGKNKELEEYYYMEEDPENDQINEVDEDDINDQSIQNVEENKNNRISKWMENYNEVSSDEEEFDQNQLLNDSEGLWSDDEQHIIKNQNVQATPRLALCNYDWMNINSKDLMLLFNSFKPSTGVIKNVSVYYSQFGKDKLEEQAQHGPSGIWNEQLQKNEQEDDDDQKFRKKTWKQLMAGSKQEQDHAFNEIKLRKYELERLKYCYAVIECDSNKTADEIYKECDSNQFESSNLLFDLRFIPDELQLPSELKKQECKQIPVGGQVKNFINRAVGHSKINLTWEDPQLSNIAGLKKKNWGKMTEEEMQKIDWGVYLNEDDLKNDVNQGKLMKKNKIQTEEKEEQVLEFDGWRKQCNKGYRKNKKSEDDIQITFQSGFGSMNKAKTDKKEGESLNHQIKTRKQRWQKKKDEKIAKRREQEQTYNSSKTFQREEQKNREKLSLLVNEENIKKRDDFKYNSQDQRFSAVFNNPMYSLDITNPKFDHRKTGEVFKEVVKRNKNKGLQ